MKIGKVMTSSLKITILIFSLLLFLFSIGAHTSVSAYSSLVDDPGVKAEEEQLTAPGEEKEDKTRPNYDTLEESLSSATGEKPTIVIPDLKIITVSNSWGKVSLDTTTVNTKIVINDPNFYLVPLKVLCDIYLNDIKVVSGLGEDLKITKCASGSLVRFTTEIKNEDIIRWWVSHIKNGERTRVKIEGKLIISLDKVDIVYPFVQESEFKTNILQGLNKRNLATIRPLNFRIQALESRWGNITLSTTEIKHKLTIKNIGIFLGQPITDIDYILTFNNIQMAKGRIKMPLLILPGQKRSAKFSLRISNRNIIKWWVSHIQNGEMTKYCFSYRFWVKPLSRSKWQKTYGSFKSNVFATASTTSEKQ